MRSWRTICECETVAVGTERGGGEGIGQDLIGDRIGLKPYLLSEGQLKRGQREGVDRGKEEAETEGRS